MSQTVEQAQVVSQSTINPGQAITQLALFGTDGDPLNVAQPVAATTTTAGVVKKMAPQVDSVAADVATLKTDFNALLAKARTAGLI